MGAHATVVRANPSLLVPVPDGLDSAVAATLPLDALTAHRALDQCHAWAAHVLVQGAGGAVGSMAVQLARHRALTVFGTASARTSSIAEGHGAHVFDYHDPAWMDRLTSQRSGGVDTAIDHTGSVTLRRVVARHGHVVRTAFGQAATRRRTTAMIRALGAVTRHLARPAERICSVPVWALTRPTHVRRALRTLLEQCAHGRLTPFTPRLVPFAEYDTALRLASSPDPGTKVVLRMPAV